MEQAETTVGMEVTPSFPYESSRVHRQKCRICHLNCRLFYSSAVMSMPLVTLLEILYFAHLTLMIDGVTISAYNRIEWMIQAGGLYKCSSLYCLQQTVLPPLTYQIV